MFPVDGPKKLAVVWLSITRGTCYEQCLFTKLNSENKKMMMSTSYIKM